MKRFFFKNITFWEKRFSSNHSKPVQQMEVSGYLHAPATLPPGMKPVIHRTGRCVVPTDGVDLLVKKKLIP